MDGITSGISQAPFKYAAVPAFDMLDQAVRRHPDRPAVDFFGRVWTWSEIGALADRAAAGLQKLGVAKGVNVGLCLPNTHYFIVMYYAILKAGGTVVNFNPLYTEREIASQAKDAEVEIMVSIDLALIQDKISNLVARNAFKRVIICRMAAALPRVKALLYLLLKAKDLASIPKLSPYIGFETIIAGAARASPVQIDPEHDLAALQFTGGTTGVPKAAMLTHANITANVQQLLASRPDIQAGRERILAVLPFFHVFAMTAIMNLGIAIGAELIVLPRLDLKQLMAAIYRCRPTIMTGVPTLYTAISNTLEAGPPERRDLSFMKHCMSGGAPIAAETAERFERVAHCHILEGYGLSEASPVVCATPTDGVKHGSVGPAISGTIVEIRDLADPSVILPSGERGEICVRGPQVMRGYWQRAAETQDVFIDGALRTGDIGYLDADGYLFIVDRIKDLILCGGYNVYPRIIEEAAYLHTAVQDATAIGIPDAYRGQTPKLFVALRPGATATVAELKAFLALHLNKIELPRDVEIRESLPKTMVGKLSKKELVAEELAKSVAAAR